MKFVKVENYWWEYDQKSPLNDAVLYNYLGGRSSGFDLRKSEMVEAKSWKDLDWSNTGVWDNHFKTGWLAPNGVFFGCDYTEHIKQARFVHGVSEGELEKNGYIKITIIKNQIQALFAGHIYDENMAPSTEQLKYLSTRYDCDLSGLYYLKEKKENAKLPKKVETEREF